MTTLRVTPEELQGLAARMRRATDALNERAADMIRRMADVGRLAATPKNGD